MGFWVSVIILICTILTLLLAFIENPLQYFINELFFPIPLLSLGFFIVIIFICILSIYRFFYPPKSTYESVQDYRHDNYYDILDYDDYLPDYDGDFETFTEDDVINAYKHGINDGIEQTIEYYESLED